MARVATRASRTRERQILRGVTDAKADGDTERLRSAALELLAAIHEKMKGVTDEGVVAIVQSDKNKSRKPASTPKRGGERTRRSASA